MAIARETVELYEKQLQRLSRQNLEEFERPTVQARSERSTYSGLRRTTNETLRHSETRIVDK